MSMTCGRGPIHQCLRAGEPRVRFEVSPLKVNIGGAQIAAPSAEGDLVRPRGGGASERDWP